MSEDNLVDYKVINGQVAEMEMRNGEWKVKRFLKKKEMIKLEGGPHHITMKG